MSENETPLSEADQFMKDIEEAEASETKRTEEQTAEVEESEEPDKKQETAEEPEPEAQPEELFPGFNALSPEAQAIVRERLQTAELATQKAQEYEQRWQAQHGQLAPTQRALEQTRKQLQELQTQVQSQRAKQEEIGKTSIKEAIARFKEQYPDEAVPFEALAATVEQHNQKVDERLAALDEREKKLDALIEHQEAQLHLQRESQTVSQRHPDWKEIYGSDYWEPWLNAPGNERLKELAQSPNASDVVFVFDQIKRDMKLAQLMAAGEQSQQAPPATTASAKKPEPAPNPTTRKPIGARPANGSASSPEADQFVADLIEAGYENG